ncbi:hypothetical protein Tco_0945716, partial [Tanacetum coccineum]
MSAMANVAPIIATVKNAGVKEKTLKETDTVPKASILDFCEGRYEDILPIIMDRALTVRDHLRGVEESYDDTYSSHGTETKYRDRSRGRDHSRSMKRWRTSESPPSRESKSSTSDKGHWKSRVKRGKPADEDLAIPWTCEDVDPFTPRIRNFKSSGKTR